MSDDGDRPTSGGSRGGGRAPGPWGDRGYNKLAVGIAIGVVVGAAIGAVLGNPGLGIAVGLALGIAVASARGYRSGGGDEDD